MTVTATLAHRIGSRFGARSVRRADETFHRPGVGAESSAARDAESEPWDSPSTRGVVALGVAMLAVGLSFPTGYWMPFEIIKPQVSPAFAAFVVARDGDDL